MSAAPNPTMGQTPDFTRVDDAAREAVQSGEIPGIVVLVGRGDEILLCTARTARGASFRTRPA